MYATAYIEVSNLRHNTGSSFTDKIEIGEGTTKQKKKEGEFAVSVLAALPLLSVLIYDTVLSFDYVGNIIPT
jgi:hypothetical protein